MSRRDLMRESGIPYTKLDGAERGQGRTFSDKELRKLAEVLKVEQRELTAEAPAGTVTSFRRGISMEPGPIRLPLTGRAQVMLRGVWRIDLETGTLTPVTDAQVFFQ